MNEIFREGRQLSYLERLINAVIIIFDHYFPNLSKFITCSENEYIVTRKLSSFIIGILYGLIVYDLSINQIEGLSDIIKKSLGLFILTFLSIGMALVPAARCAMTLATFNFLSSFYKITLSSYIAVNLFKGPIENSLANVNEITKSISCQYKMLSNVIKLDKSKFILQREMASELVEANLAISNDQQDINFLVNEISDEIKIKRKTKERYNENQDYDFNENTLNKNASKKFEIEKNKSFQKELVNDLNAECLGMFKSFDSIAEKAKNRVNGKIKQFEPTGIFYGGIEMEVKSKKVACNKEIKESDYKGLDKDMNNLEKTQYIITNDFEGVFEHDINLKESSVRSKEKIVNLNTMLDKAKGFTKFMSKILEVIIKSLKLVTSFAFSIVFFSSYNYCKKYMTDIEFDNFIITQYFRHIDARRFMAGKRTLLPLRNYEKEYLAYPYQFYVSRYQNISVKKNVFLNKCLIFFIFLMLFIDYVLYDFMSILRDNSDFQLHHKSESSVNYTVKGNGPIANLIRKTTKYLNQDKTKNHEIDMKFCMLKVNQLEMNAVIQLFYQTILLILLIIIEIYVKRFNRNICAYFNRKREKKRIIWLYNTSIQKRMTFLKNAKCKVMFKKENNLIEKDSFFKRFLLHKLKSIEIIFKTMQFFGIGIKYCILCDLEERKSSVKCEICSVVYCFECWIDLNEICVGCSEEDNEHLN